MSDGQVDRREFFRRAGQGALGCACVGALTGCGDYTFDTLSSDVTVVRADFPALADVGSVIEVSREVTGFGHPIFVYNDGDGVFLAMSGECAHEGCSVFSVEGGGGFQCSCHGARFSAVGALVSGPATLGLHMFDVVVSDETLLIKANG